MNAGESSSSGVTGAASSAAASAGSTTGVDDGASSAVGSGAIHDGIAPSAAGSGAGGGSAAAAGAGAETAGSAADSDATAAGSGAGGGSSVAAGAGAATAGSAAASDAAEDARERDAAGDPTDEEGALDELAKYGKTIANGNILVGVDVAGNKMGGPGKSGWPSRSPDLNIMDEFIWGIMVSHMRFCDVCLSQFHER